MEYLPLLFRGNCMKRNRYYVCFTTFIYVVTFLISVPYFTEDLPYSAIFKRTFSKTVVEQRAKGMNNVRLKRAKDYLTFIKQKESVEFYENIWNVRKFETVITTCTVSRQTSAKLNVETGYLTQSSAMVDKLLKSSPDPLKQFFIICNTDSDPTNHHEFQQLSSYIPWVKLYGENSGALMLGERTLMKVVGDDQLAAYQVTNNFSRYEKEKNDYTFCLNFAWQLKSKMVLLMQDDAVPMRQAFDVISVMIKQTVQELYQNPHATRKEFAFLSLYYPEKWLGYSNEMVSISELIAIGCVGGAINLLIFLSFKYTTNHRTSCSVWKLYAVFAIGLVYSILLCLLLGRQNVLELRRVSSHLYTLKNARGCCIPAVLYSSSFIPALVSFLRETKVSNSRPVDLAIADFVVKGIQWKGYYAEPNVFHHIGMYTSLKPGDSKGAEDFVIRMEYVLSVPK